MNGSCYCYMSHTNCIFSLTVIDNTTLSRLQRKKVGLVEVEKLASITQLIRDGAGPPRLRSTTFLLQNQSARGAEVY